MVEETNGALRTKNTQVSVDREDVLQYIGILLFMSVYKYPSLESYWGEHAFAPIQKTMSLTRFIAIDKLLCLENKSDRIGKGQPGYDPLVRIRKIADELNKQFDGIPKVARLCVDHQLLSRKEKRSVQVQNKLQQTGLKLFVLCDALGYVYKFEICNGSVDNIASPGSPDLGAASNIVVRLSQSVPDRMHHTMCFDNNFTSVPLLMYLRSRGIYSVGSFRSDEISNCKLPLECELKNEPSGYSAEYVSNVNGASVNVVLWKNDKCIRMASTYAGVEPLKRMPDPNQQRTKANRSDKGQKPSIDFPHVNKSNYDYDSSYFLEINGKIFGFL